MYIIFFMLCLAQISKFDHFGVLRTRKSQIQRVFDNTAPYFANVNVTDIETVRLKLIKKYDQMSLIRYYILEKP